MADVIPKEIDRDALRLLVRRGAQLIEVLPREEYERIHLSGAISIPLAMISRHTADRLQWDKPVIVYSRDSLCDVSARAAWRLSTLGFTQVFRYTPGKADWMANGLPAEGAQARDESAADLADMDVPTCKRGERVGDVRSRVGAAGWNSCVVVTDQLVVLGILRANDLANAEQRLTAEEAMERDPLTFRLDANLAEIAAALVGNPADSVLITATDGKLFGLLKRGEVEARLAKS